MKFLPASKLLVLPFLASVNAVQAVEEDAAANVKGSFLKDHRALHQQKFNEFKIQSRKLQEYSEETLKLLNCWEKRDYPVKGSVIYTVNKKDYDVSLWTDDNECQENYKRIPLEYVFCEGNEGGSFKYEDSVCIPDDDACPNDFGAFVAAIADALQTEGDDVGYEMFSEYAEQFTSVEKCVYPQCFATAEKKGTFTTTYVWEGVVSFAEEFPPSPYSCPEIGGTCEVDCESDREYMCLPDLCYSNKDYDPEFVPPGSSRETRPDAADESHLRAGFGGRELKGSKGGKGSKSGKSPKGSKSSKAGKDKCTCKVPRIQLPPN